MSKLRATHRGADLAKSLAADKEARSGDSRAPRVAAADELVQLGIRIRREVSAELAAAAKMQGLTAKGLILRTLREAGYLRSVTDEDLEDRRGTKGR